MEASPHIGLWRCKRRIRQTNDFVPWSKGMMKAYGAKENGPPETTLFVGAEGIQRYTVCVPSRQKAPEPISKSASMGRLREYEDELKPDTLLPGLS
jgi:hypothetical protein